jgi:hypothetical protein
LNGEIGEFLLNTFIHEPLLAEYFLSIIVKLEHSGCFQLGVDVPADVIFEDVLSIFHVSEFFELRVLFKLGFKQNFLHPADLSDLPQFEFLNDNEQPCELDAHFLSVKTFDEWVVWVPPET